MLISFPGTLGVYQGEEVGQTETDIEFHELQDLGNIDFWPDNKGRDGCRTPMVWDESQPNAGFSTGTPWLPVKPPQAAHAVAGQEGKNDSVLATYRAALAFRKSRPELTLGETTFPKVRNPLLAVCRTHEGVSLTGVFNLSDQPQSLRVDESATLVGAAEGELGKGRLKLPPFGYAYVETREIARPVG
jgi:alpha-glucosidase